MFLPPKRMIKNLNEIDMTDIFSSENSGVIVRPTGSTSSESNETIVGKNYIYSVLIRSQKNIQEMNNIERTNSYFWV